jgi:hypothetical protein
MLDFIQQSSFALGEVERYGIGCLQELPPTASDIGN